MTLDQITVRLEQHIIEHLKEESKRRGQTVAALARTFIRDGLARYDAISEELLQADERIEKRLLQIESMIAANLHLTAEQPILANKQNDGESLEVYSARLNEIYRDKIRMSVKKGARIVAEIDDGKL